MDDQRTPKTPDEAARRFAAMLDRVIDEWC
jgi:hypothetical protein